MGQPHKGQHTPVGFVPHAHRTHHNNTHKCLKKKDKKQILPELQSSGRRERKEKAEQALIDCANGTQLPLPQPLSPTLQAGTNTHSSFLPDPKFHTPPRPSKKNRTFASIVCFKFAFTLTHAHRHTRHEAPFSSSSPQNPNPSPPHPPPSKITPRPLSLPSPTPSHPSVCPRTWV